MKLKSISVISIFLALCILLCGCVSSVDPQVNSSLPSSSVSSGEIPAPTNEPYSVLNDNIPSFANAPLTAVSFERFSELDDLGRCGVAEACVGVDIMPTEERGALGQVKPSGWHTVKYDIVDGKYLYNRCHLIGFQLTGENANEQNLITGTRYFNVEGMLPFENMVADYVKETENHVTYRVTPVYDGDNLVAKGVQMEAFSVEDKGEGICFNVFVHNIQPGITINYETGESTVANPNETQSSETGNTTQEYVLNMSSKKFHLSSCTYAKDINPENKKIAETTKENLINSGYNPCKSCNP